MIARLAFVLISLCCLWSATAQVGPIPGFGPLPIFGNRTTTTFDPATVTTTGVLSNGNRSFAQGTTGGGAATAVRGTGGTVSKTYMEFTYTTLGNSGYDAIGVIDDSQATTTPTGCGNATMTAKEWIYRDDAFKCNNNVTTSYGSSSTTGTVISMAVDNSLGSGSGKVWWGVCSGGVISWFGSGNPITGANAAYSNLTGTIKPWVNLMGNISGPPKVTGNFGLTSYNCTPPSGFGNF